MPVKTILEKETYSGLAINDVIYRIIRPGTKVLDLGCGNGVLGESLRKNKKCYVCGLEFDAKLAEQARSRLDTVICEDINNLDKLSFNNKFDYVVCADILEHIIDPMPILRCIKGLLDQDGYLLVSIPNIANWDIRLRLLAGRFEYKPLTITDPGHMRFYTKSTAKRLLEDAGYTVMDILPKNSAYKRDFLMRWLGRLWGNMFAYQFIFVAKAGDHRDTGAQRSQRKKNIFYLCVLRVFVPLWF